MYHYTIEEQIVPNETFSTNEPAVTETIVPQLNRLRIGRQLIIAAWAIEILAAAIGILIAVLVVVSTQHAIGDTSTDESNIASGLMTATAVPYVSVK